MITVTKLVLTADTKAALLKHHAKKMYGGMDTYSSHS